jgi:predicted DCC family thiol-disulfide oxidoreductase YuxK
MSQEVSKKPTIFYDRLCPVCNFEVNMLRKKDRNNAISFVDITQADFIPEKYGKQLQDFIGSIHGINRQGELIKGVDVFVEIYQAIGLGWVYSWTRWPIICPIVDFAYLIFAKIRPSFSNFKPACSIEDGPKRCR